MFYKINNLMKGNSADYKGLNLELFVPGSQIYKPDLSFCVIETQEENEVIHPDLTLLDEAGYNSLVSAIQTENDALKVSTDQRIKNLEDQIATLTAEIEALKTV